jgi:voltage-gated potassium channel
MGSESSRGGVTGSLGFQIFMLGLSIYAIAALLIDLVVKLPPDASRMIQYFDFAVCGIFLIDFVVQFHLAPRKLQYMKTGWMDLLASIPTVDVLRWGRLVRVFRIFRVLRAVRGGYRIWHLLFATRGNATGSATITILLLIAFSSVSILMVEQGPEANIKTAEDALWWSFTTVTTVGYGDRYPTSTEGRAIAVVLMMAGIGLLGSITAFVASYFLGNQAAADNVSEQAEFRALEAKLDALHENVAALKIMLESRNSYSDSASYRSKVPLPEEGR